MAIDITRLVHFDDRDFVVSPYSGGDHLVPGDTFLCDGEQMTFRGIAGDPEHAGFQRVEVASAGGTVSKLDPRRVALSINAYVDGTHSGDRPHGGDGIRLAAPWEWGMQSTGAIGVLGGYHTQESDWGSVTMNASTHRDRRTGLVQCSGGPATIHIETTRFRATDDTTTVMVWDWGTNSWHGRDEAVFYLVKVRVWDWTPDD